MKITPYQQEFTIEYAKARDELIIAAISFDASRAYIAHVNDAPEHHILLAKSGISSKEIDRHFRIIFDESGAEWTFVCPPDYKSIPDKTRRIAAFYEDGFAVISEFLAKMGYLSDITIPKRYRRHFEGLKES